MAFWKTKSLDEMTSSEWESLCDGCGRCCVVQRDLGDGRGFVPTQAACRLLDPQSCRCTSYRRRTALVSDCLRVTPGLARTLSWIPPTCAYRLLAEGKPLYDWHPLVSGDPESVHRAGISVRGRVVDERYVHEDDLVPLRWSSGDGD